MKLYSQTRKANRSTLRLVSCLLALCIIAFDYNIVVCAREPVSFSVKYSSSIFHTNSNYNVVAYVRCVLSYDDLVSYLGTTSIGDTLTFTVNSASNFSYSTSTVSNASARVANANPNGGIIIYATPAGGGSTASTGANFGEEVTISYGGGDIEFRLTPAYLSITPSSSSWFITTTVNSTWSFSFAGAPRSDNEALNDLVDNQEKYRQEDREDAEQAGTDAGNLVEEMQTLKEKWEILWYPIEFTNQVLNVFTGGSSSAAYTVKYYNVKGYSYDDKTGMLVPIRDPVMTIADAQASAGSASITFPEYTLPVLNVKLWDAYTFDLTFIKDSFPMLFDAIYVVTTVLEMYWFVAFLRSKFEEVFG